MRLLKIMIAPEQERLIGMSVMQKHSDVFSFLKPNFFVIDAQHFCPDWVILMVFWM